MSLENLQLRLNDLQETTSQLKDLIDKLQNLDFQNGSVYPGAEDDSAVTELRSEISQTIREQEDELELLQEDVEEFSSGRPGSETEHTKTWLQDGLSRLNQELKSSRTNYKKAQLAAKRNQSQAQHLERQSLLRSFSESISQTPLDEEGKDPMSQSATLRHQQHRHHDHPARQGDSNKSTLSKEDQQTVGASGDVTSALRRTHDIIAAELARSEFAHQTLTESSAALARLDESYGSLEGMLASSKDLLGTLVRSQKSDTWYLQTSLYMLAVTAAWLIFRRLLFGPTWWLVWLPLRMIYSVLTGGGSAVVKLGGTGAGREDGLGVEEGQQQGKISVDGIPGEDLPTVDVGGVGDDSGKQAKGGEGSLSEEVGKIIDAAANGEGVHVKQDGSGEAQQQQRDEL